MNDNLIINDSKSLIYSICVFDTEKENNYYKLILFE